MMLTTYIKYQIYIIIFLIDQLYEAKLLFPEAENIAVYKPITIQPIGSTCGLELKDTLCDNRIQDSKSCSNSSSLFYCDQSCPFGNILTDLDTLEQLKLETMNPCHIVKDFSNKLSQVNKETENSYYFDKTNSLCINNDEAVRWKTFDLLNSQANPTINFYNLRTPDLHILNSGFTFSLWFRQFRINNGTLLNLIDDNNNMIFLLNIQSSLNKIFINYICNKNKRVGLCYMEINTSNLLNGTDDSNFLCLKIYRNIMNIFINEPNEINEIPKLGNIDLKFDLGSYILNNSKDINFLIGSRMNGQNHFFGWMQEVNLFLIALVNIEISYLYGKKYQTTIQSECRCSNQFPRNQDKDSVICLLNRNDTNIILNSVSRLNNYAHPINYINDDDFTTNWISCILTVTNPITFVLDFENGIYILQRIEIYFTSLPPTDLIFERYIDNDWLLLQAYSIDCDPSGRNSSCVKLPDQFNDKYFNGYTLVWSVNFENETLFYSNQTLVEKSRASKVRVILKGYYPNAKRDIRQLYYAISELKVKGSCDCNGYSSKCDPKQIPFKCECEPESFTQGNACNECLPLYNDKKFTTRYQNNLAICSLCNCNNRSDSCQYDSKLNTGTCLNCTGNTAGPKCDSCAFDSYFDEIEKRCTKCNCNLDGVITFKNKSDVSCDQKNTQCNCKQNIAGLKCDRCKDGYFNFTKENPLGCSKCSCNRIATINLTSELSSCDAKTGQCDCISPFVQGLKCDSCVESTFNLTSGCKNQCNCDPFGSINPICDEKGQCNCKNKIAGLKCNVCEQGYYNLTRLGCISKCNCDSKGSLDIDNCDSGTGQCNCKIGYTGRSCDKCSNGYWRANNTCIKCNCNLYGILNEDNICDQMTGRCICNNLSEGFSCDKCRPGYWGLGKESKNGCQKCECDSIGTNPNSIKNDIYICDPVTSQCECNPNRIGVKCETCAVGFFFLNLNGIDCLECNCDPIGSIPGSNCDSLTGECSCKVSNGIGGTRCDQCSFGFYNFSRVTGSCSPCGCNVAGSLDQDCDINTGICNCKPFVTGAKCNQCIPGTSNLDIKNPFGCSQAPSKQSPPRFSVLNANSLIVLWNPPDYPNGIIRYYLVYRNQTLITNTTKQNFEDKNVIPFVNYAYRIQSFNDEGNTTSKLAYVTIIAPSYPCCGFNFRLFNIRSTRIDIIWTLPVKNNGLNMTYFIKVFKRIDYFRPLSFSNLVERTELSVELAHNDLLKTEPLENNYFTYRMINLQPYTQYFLNIKACNRDLNDTKKLFCLEGTPDFNQTYNLEKENSLNNSIGFLTSQDRPELQPAPTLLTINSSYIGVGILRPERPNGIILLYEVFIKRFDLELSGSNNTFQEVNNQQLACTIEDLYDPNDIYSIISGNKPKLCMIKNLNYYTKYILSATSSTIVGRSSPSIEVVFTTLENKPLCGPQILNAFSYSTDSIYLKWFPTPNMTETVQYWRRCIGGVLKNFTIYQFEPTNNSFRQIHKGPDNSFNITKLNFSTQYEFKIELCNGIGCASTEIIKVTTIDPLPNPWGNINPKFKFINSTFIQFDWNDYVPFRNYGAEDSSDSSARGRVNFRLERSEVSFAYPPTPLESGIRFHGLNFFKFLPEKFFPEGYPYFGLKYSFKTKKNTSLTYFATSAYDQTELKAIQMVDGRPELLSVTQASDEACSIYLNTKNKQSLINNKWHTLKVFRIRNFAYIGVGNETQSTNLTTCTNNNVITDVTGVYLGGVPRFFVTRNEVKFANNIERSIVRENFIGCMKNISTIIDLEDVTLSNLTSVPNVIDARFDFTKHSDFDVANGEPVGSNAIFGCPLNLETDYDIFNLLGFGFLFINLKQTFPITYQTSRFLIIDFDFRTEWSHGILFLNFDYENDQYIMVNLIGNNQFQVTFHCRVKYEDPNSTDKRFTNYFILNFNETFSVKNIDNGYWGNFNLKFDFENSSMLLLFNQTRISNVKLINEKSVDENVIDKIRNFSLLFNYYLDVRFYFGGIEASKLNEVKEQLNDPYVSSITRYNFLPFLDHLLYLDHDRYFSGCLKNIKINSIPLEFNNQNDNITYQNVRFDGCPNLNYISLKQNVDFMMNDNVDNLVSKKKSKLLYEGDKTNWFDNSFYSYTEYFYRVVAYNIQGESPSNWILVRTPDAIPPDFINSTLMKITPKSGYKTLIEEMKNYCYYCDTNNRLKSRFTGIIQTFNLIVHEFNQSSKEYDRMTQNFTFYCETVCFKSNSYSVSTKIDIYENLIKEDSDPNSISLYIDTTPITKYSLTVSICNQIGCSFSKPVNIVSLAEVPDGILPPKLLKRKSNSLYLTWEIPKFPSGNITGYILRQVNPDSENVIFFGLKREFEVTNLKPGTNYTFVLEVCNSIGCGRSDFVYFETSETAPLSVNPPIILNLTETIIYLKWNKPTNDQLDGAFLTGYILYVSSQEYFYNFTSLAFNITTCAECAASYRNLTGLIPGSEYKIVLSACTNGGCTNSSEIKISTIETWPIVDDIVIYAKNKTSTSILIEWSYPRRPNGKLNKYTLFKNDIKLYDGVNNSFLIQNLKPNSLQSFSVIFCNNFACSNKSKTYTLSTDEAIPEGIIILEGEATGSNQIELKWYSKPGNPLKSNGNILFQVFVEGPFLLDFSQNESLEFKKDNRPFTEIMMLNLLNTTTLNTKYGLVDRILPYSMYQVFVNATNTKGFVLSNKLTVETFKSGPNFALPPQLSSKQSRQLKIEWYDPILVNSEDKIIFFQVNYRYKYLWNSNGTIRNPKWESKIITIFQTRTLATTYTLNNLVPYTSYSFQLVVSNKYGQSISDWSDEYTTLEEIPRSQQPPEIVSIKEDNAFIKWKPPNEPNGLIISYTIYVLEYKSDEKRLYPYKNITVDGNTTSCLVTDLESFSFYWFRIESYNSISCASNPVPINNIDKDPGLIKTLPSPPKDFDDPQLESLNSYSIDISWKEPKKPNGEVKYYILERKDYSFPFAVHVKNPSLSSYDYLNTNYTNKIIKYRFEANRFKFTDYQNLESCGVYSYRMIVYNQVGNTTTNWINGTIQASKPLIVTMPVVNLIDSTTARFEWITPLTYCTIKTYTLIFKPLNGKEFQISIDNSSFSRQSIVVKQLMPFTKYSVSLISCVDYEKEACTQSLTRNFQTPGSIPQGITSPFVRLVSSNSISIEWLEPLFKNGETLEYQLLRVANCLNKQTKCDKNAVNRTETIYFGRDNYYLDTHLKSKLSYYYKVVYTNEFGYSISPPSIDLSILNDTDENDYNYVNNDNNSSNIENNNNNNNNNKEIQILFNLNSECSSPTSAYLNWNTYSRNELLNIVKKLSNSNNNLDSWINDQYPKDNTIIQYKNISDIINVTIQINNKIEISIGSSQSSNKIDHYMITNLKPDLFYEFRLKLSFNIETINETIYGKIVVNNETFSLISELVNCKTLSLDDLFEGEIFSILNLKSNYLNISYNLNEILSRNYQIYQLNLTKYYLNESLDEIVIDYKKFSNSFGFKIMGPIEENQLYSIILLACSSNSTRLLYDINPDLFLEKNCIQTIPQSYSLTSKPPENITDLNLFALNYSSIKVQWGLPLSPNDFRLNYLIFRRETCDLETDTVTNNNLIDNFHQTTTPPYEFLNDNENEHDENEVEEENDNLICCNGLCYEKKYGYDCCDTNYLPRPFNYSSVCCGGKFVRELKDFQCCANLYYLYVPVGSVCCKTESFNKNDVNEIRINVGLGDSCCSDVPYFMNNIQSCCNYKIATNYLTNYQFKFKPYLRDDKNVYDFNECYSPKYTANTLSKCKSYELISNITSALTLNFNDINLDPFTSYDYRYCIQNSFDRTCNDKTFRLETNASLPKDFKYFNYEIINDNFIYLSWNFPIFMNGLLDHFKLIRNGFEIYKGKNIFYEDMTRQIQPYVPYKYELKVCNQIGCVMNNYILLASTKEKLPELFESINFNVSNSSVKISWKLPQKPNGVIEKFVLIIKEIDFELTIYNDFQKNTTQNTISAKNPRFNDNLYFSADALFDRFSNFGLTITDLIPNTKYSFKLFACNKAGCTMATNKNLNIKNDFITLFTDDYFLIDFQNPAVYAIDDTTIEIVWQEPKQSNYIFTKYKLFRNDRFLIDFDLTSNFQYFKYELGFFSYLDKNLSPNTFYSYRIEIISKQFTSSSKSFMIQTSPSRFDLKCFNKPSNVFLNTKYSSILNFLDTLFVNFTTNSSTNISLFYNNSHWKSFISCLSKSNYNNLNHNLTQLDSSIFSMKILLQSESNGLQSIDFPYPSTINNEMSRFMITGLLPYSNYSIRISFSTQYPNRQILTTRAIYLQTFDQAPCCVLKQPIVIRQYTSRVLSIKWQLPDHPNGLITRFSLLKAKLIGNGCIPLASTINSQIESTTEIQLSNNPRSFNDDYFYDSTNDMFIYRDSNLLTYSYFSYKLVAYNSKGKIESIWSLPVKTLIFTPPSPPFDVKITEAHSSGFIIKFKEPQDFGGLLSHYTIKLSELSTAIGANRVETQEIIKLASKKCKTDQNDPNSIDSQYVEVPISGLKPFKSYKIIVYATNRISLNSDESERIIANTLESTPSNLKPLYASAVESLDNKNYTQSILFKFYDPEYLNGVLTSFNLYQIIDQNASDSVNYTIFYDYQLKLVYSDTKREFLYTNLKPYRNYSFIYEVCTYVSCTRQTKLIKILTLESPPLFQTEPVPIRLLSNLNCYQIFWTDPLNPNGVIRYFELYRKKSVFNSSFNSEILIKNLTNLNLYQIGQNNYSYIDCSLEPNFKYTYKIYVYNNKGFAISNYSKPAVISQPFPQNFNPISIKQINDSLIKIDWSRPNMPNGQILSYNIYRDSILISNSTDILDFDSVKNLTYFDSFDILPNTVYKYKIYACNEAGCSTDDLNFAKNIYSRDQPPIRVNLPILVELEKNRATLSALNSVVLKSSKTQKVVEYNVYSNESFGLFKLINKGSSPIIKLDNLKPYTTYRIKLEACTFTLPVGGCLISKEILTFLTNQSRPADLDDLVTTDEPFNEYYLSVKIKWMPPRSPNGVLKLLELKRNNSIILSSKNIGLVNSFVDNGLIYGKTYFYDLTYYNDIGSISTTKSHITQENLPISIDKPKCIASSSTEIKINWTDPIFPNGHIQNYEIRYRRQNEDLKWKQITLKRANLTQNVFKIDQLEPYTQYEFQIGCCNTKGCSYSNITDNDDCFTLEGIPVGLSAPECTEVSPLSSNKINIKIEWKKPSKSNNIDIIYTLYRVNIKLSITYDSDYNYIDNNMVKKDIYNGRNTSFLDSNVGPFNTYDYFISIKTASGSSISPYTRYTTRAMYPLFLIQIGECVSITHQSASFNLKPPLYINGVLINIFLILLAEDKTTRDITLYSFNTYNKFDTDLSSANLLKLLNNITIYDLTPETKYELKTKFCNQIGCLMSFDSIKFETLNNDKIVLFTVKSKTSTKIELVWKLRYYNINLKDKIRYELRVLSNLTNEIVYNGSHESFIYEAKPYNKYDFEITALKDLSKTIVIDRQIISVLTHSEKPSFNQYPLIDIDSLSNKSVILDIDWLESFVLNGPLNKYQIFLNNINIYEGNFTNLQIVVNITECLPYKPPKKPLIPSLYSNGYYFPVVLRIKVFTDLFSALSPDLEIPVNCTSDIGNISYYKNNALLESWIGVVIFLIGLILLIGFIIAICYFITKNRRQSAELKFKNIDGNFKKLPSTISKSKYVDWNSNTLTCNGESESPSIKEILDLQDAFSNLSKKSIYSLKFDYEKSKALKNIVEFKAENSVISKAIDDSLSKNDNFILKDGKSYKKFPITIEGKFTHGKKKLLDSFSSYNDKNERIYAETSYI